MRRGPRPPTLDLAPTAARLEYTALYGAASFCTCAATSSQLQTLSMKPSVVVTELQTALV
jgi:hypothetical protein